MKPIRLILFVALVFSAGLTHGQTPGASPNRPPASPEPALRPIPEPPAASPKEIVDRFFESIRADKVDEAYSYLTKDTVVATLSGEVASLRAKTQKALDAYGPVKAHELVDERAVGTWLVRKTYMLVCEQLPLRWRFYFYRGSGNWKLVDLRVDDALVDLVEEAGRKKE